MPRHAATGHHPAVGSTVTPAGATRHGPIGAAVVLPRSTAPSHLTSRHASPHATTTTHRATVSHTVTRAHRSPARPAGASELAAGTTTLPAGEVGPSAVRASCELSPWATTLRSASGSEAARATRSSGAGSRRSAATGVGHCAASIRVGFLAACRLIGLLRTVLFDALGFLVGLSFLVGLGFLVTLGRILAVGLPLLLARGALPSNRAGPGGTGAGSIAFAGPLAAHPRPRRSGLCQKRLGRGGEAVRFHHFRDVRRFGNGAGFQFDRFGRLLVNACDEHRGIGAVDRQLDRVSGRRL